MDTDNLSQEAYYGILIEAEKLTHDLTLHYGVMAGNCQNETEYLDKAEKLTRAILEANGVDLDDLFWGNPPNKKQLNTTLRAILKNIDQVRSIPIDKRTYDF